jgi:soluble lytic murein transglycosylase
MLILSVMREESHFNPQVKSIAGAIGLMQLMPKTAEYMAQKTGTHVTIDSLNDPEVNLRLGSAYLKNLMNRYEGNLFYTLAAYNGGPSNVTRWLQKTKTKDNDDFIETITYRETQNYVRRVMRSYYLYRYLYE